MQFSGSIRKEKEGFLCIETGNLKTNFNEILTSFNIKFSFAESTMEKVESVNAALYSQQPAGIVKLFSQILVPGL